MKAIIHLLGCLVILVSSLQAQGLKKLEIEVIYGTQASDKRFYHPIEGITQKDWGTIYYGLRLTAPIIEKKAFKIRGGLGYTREINTFSTPYNLCLDRPGESCPYILAYLDRYQIDLVSLLS